QGQRILDIGGQRRTWRDLDPDLAWRGNVVKLTEPHEEGAPPRGVGDALRVPFSDQWVDVAFSKSVIEHLRGRTPQAAFAREVRRVGQRYWVQAPNRLFPIEPHFLFPFFQFLPITLRMVIARYWPFVWDRHYGHSTEIIVETARTIRLPTVREFQEIFP